MKILNNFTSQTLKKKKTLICEERCDLLKIAIITPHVFKFEPSNIHLQFSQKINN